MAESRALPLRRLARLSVVLSGFVAVQGLVQGLGIVAGFIILRALPKPEFALYILASSGLTALFALSNSGIIDVATAIGGRGRQSPAELGQVLASAWRCRRRLVLLLGGPTLLVVGCLLHRSGAGWGTLAALLLAVAMTGEWQLSWGILSVTLRLAKRVGDLQWVDLAAALLRCTLATGLFLWGGAVPAMLIGTASAGTGFLLSRRRAAAVADLQAPAEPAVERQIVAVARRQWLNEISNILQSQMVVVILGLLGRVEEVADIGAAGRIAAAFAVLTALLQSVVLPHYARCQDPATRRRLYWRIMLAFALVAALPTGVALVAPRPLLWLLGSRYDNLTQLLPLVMLSAGVAWVVLVSLRLNSVRAWILPPWLTILTGVGSQAVFMTTVGIATVEQLLWVSTLTGLVAITVNMAATVIYGRGFRH